VSDGLDSIAAELDQRALRIEATGARLVHEAATAIWTSIAADAFRAQVGRRRDECGSAARSLRVAAADVRSFAAQVEEEKARLRRLALAAEHLGARPRDLVRGVREIGSLVCW
jgi:hypothetical protein